MLILVGPSASGKTEAVKILISKYNMHKLVTYTTRPMRSGEVKDVDYHFISAIEFKNLMQKNFFLEYVEYNGNYYGTAYEDLASDKVVILEPSGVKEYLKKVPDQIKICYLKTSIAVRLKRMISRGDEMRQIEKRIQNDDNIFNREIEEIADWVIDSDNVSIEEMTDQIYHCYLPYLMA